MLLTDYAWPDVEIERGILADADAELVVASATDEATLVREAADADAIMTNWASVTASVIQAATQCQIIARLGIGLDSIDVGEATRRGIAVTNVPDYCLIEVAEHALALLLALARKVAFFHLATKQGHYELGAGPRLARIEGQTLGIVGLGHIGRRLARKALALGLRVVAADPYHGELPEGVAWRELDELLAESDYVSLHVPLIPETQHLIGADQLSRMKPTAYLINTARGGLVDQQALAAALASDRLAGAALDVQELEPPDLNRSPLDDPRVIVTPHAAFYSEESVHQLRVRTSRQVAAKLTGGAVENVVNAVALGDSEPG